MNFVAIARPTTRSEPGETPMRQWLSSQSSMPTADLDDVAQEVFSRLLRYDDETLIECPQSFVLRIAANVVDELRAHSENDSPASGAATDLSAGPDRTDISTRQAIAARLKIALEQLPPRQRAMLMMHVDQDLSYQQIAVSLSLNPRVVRRDLARAYAQLRSGLSTAELTAACET